MGFDDDKHPRDDHGRFSSLGAWADKKTGEKRTDAEEKIGVREATPREFRKVFATAFKDSDFKNHVTHYTKAQLRGMKLFVSGDGKAGVAVHDHGDGRIEATALFNTSPIKGSGVMLLDHSIQKAGVNYVECYGPKLNELYAALGFKTSEKFAFDPKQAAEGWNYGKFDHPDYHIMRLPRAA